jgi:hypothetical protein
MRIGFRAFTVTLVILSFVCTALVAADNGARWHIGTPITTFWGGPHLTDGFMGQMKAGSFNLAFAYGEQELEFAQRSNTRVMLYAPDLINEQILDDPVQLAKLDAMIERVKTIPMMYFYFVTDEPNASHFAALAKLVAHLKERDPAHPGYINLLPTYATNEQLGTKGDVTTAYREYLRQFIKQVKPTLLSYDHYHFFVNPTTGEKSDGPQYFLNLALIREAALNANIPFMNIVQGSSWEAGVRIPTVDEIRWLNYTSLAYGAQAIMYFVFSNSFQFESMKEMNPQFISIASQLQPLRSFGAYHVGNVPLGGVALPKNAAVALSFSGQGDSLMPASGMLLGYFGKTAKSKPTHVLVVNLNYKNTVTTTVKGSSKLSEFDPLTGKWTFVNSEKLAVSLPPGGGKLVRLR